MPPSPDPPVRVRFAPSPTGLLHIGGLRTALYNYLFARKHGGQFLLRIEDTDRGRYVEEAEPDILASLAWAGLSYDEGPGRGGPHAPYYQSQRQEHYRHYAEQLVEAGYAYYAFDTPEEVQAMRERMQQAGNPSAKYDAVTRRHMNNALTLSDDEVQRRLEAGQPYVIRLKVPRSELVHFKDLIRGEVTFASSRIDDQVLLKSDGMPTYHLANIVDDHLMEITHVIRGEEWLSSTPKHILLYQFLGWTPPTMAHLPLILSPTGGKLSKRNAEKMGIPVSVRQYREAGYEPEALLNFLAFLGWNPGTEEEVFTLEGLVEAFSIDRVGSAGVQFNLDKLRWFNQQHLRRLSADDLLARVRLHLQDHSYAADAAYLRRVTDLLHDRMTLADDLATTYRFFFEDPTEYDEKGVKKRWKEDSTALLTAYADRLEQADPFSEETAEAILRALAEENQAGAGRIIHPTRLAVSGTTAGPSLFAMMDVLGRETCVRRLRRAVEVLG